MPELSELNAAIRAAGFSWTARDVPKEEHRGLGWEPTPQPLLNNVMSAATLLKAERLPALVHLEDTQSAVALATPPHPTAFDWRSRGVVGPVTDQRYCGSCVSFATVGLTATQAAIELGARNLDLSEADQHFCSSHGAHCGGWNNGSALGQIRSRGVSMEYDFPYMGAFDNPPKGDPNDVPTHIWLAYCRPQPLRGINTYKITNYHGWTGDERKYYLATTGPLVCGYTVFEDFFSYGGGVYRHVTGKAVGGHAVLVVGYSDVDQAWICRNSWGTPFGGAARPDGTGAGYFKIGYGECNIDAEPMMGATGVLPPVQRLRIGLAELNGRLYLGWKGMYRDDRVFLSSTNGTGWAPQAQVGGIGSSSGPSFANFAGRIYAAWKGVTGDQAIWWSSFDGATWAPQQRISGVATSVGPSVAVFNNRFYAAWKGMDNDQGIYWSSSDGHVWAPQQRIGGVASSHGPSLATFQNRLYAAWKGMNNDQGIYWSSFDGSTWAPQRRIGNVATSTGPTVAVFQNRLYAAWKGMGNDQGIYWSSFDGTNWAPQQRVSGVASSVGPTIGVFQNKLYAVWKGMDNDQHLWWSTFNGTSWTPQAVGPGNTCPDD